MPSERLPTPRGVSCSASYSDARLHLRDAENGILSSATEGNKENIERGRRKRRCAGQRERFSPSPPPHKRHSMLHLQSETRTPVIPSELQVSKTSTVCSK